VYGVVYNTVTCPRGDAPPIFEATEQVPDLVPSPVKTLGTVGFLQSGAAAWDDRQRAFVFDLLAYSGAVVGLIRGNREWRAWRGQYIFDDLAVVDLSSGHCETERPTFAIDNRMDFRGSTASADANRLIFLPPFAPLAAR